MSRQLEPYQQIERSIQKTYHKRLWTPFITAVKQYDLCLLYTSPSPRDCS